MRRVDGCGSSRAGLRPESPRSGRARPRARCSCRARARCPASRSAMQPLGRRRREPDDLLVEHRRVVAQHVLREQQHVAAARAQRRQRDVDDVDAVVEVLAERAWPRPSPRGRGSSRRPGGRRSATSASAPTGRTLRSWSARSSFGCSASAISPISSRNSVPPFACWNRPWRALLRVGERALRVTEQLALEQRLGHRRAVDRDERPVLAPRPLVDRARDDLLAGAALAGDQHRRVGRAT